MRRVLVGLRPQREQPRAHGSLRPLARRCRHPPRQRLPRREHRRVLPAHRRSPPRAPMTTSLTPDALAGWLAGQVDGPVPAVSFAATSDNAGFSGETVLVDVSWVEDRLPSGAYVLKMPPV